MGKKLTIEEFKEKIKRNPKSNEFDILEFNGTKQPVKVFHKKCGNVLTLNANTLLGNGGCSICAGNYKRSVQEWNDYINIDGYTVIGTNSKLFNKTKMVELVLKHDICGNEFKMLPHNIINNGNRCPFCNSGSKYAAEKIFLNILKSEPNYTLLDEYSGCKNKVKLLHSVCNSEFYMTPDHFKRGERCPYCAESKGERKINKILTENNIEFTQQFSFADLRDTLPLKFDFMINGKNILIEYDGEQHYKPVIYGKKLIRDREKFYLMRRHDIMKDKYCIKHKIPLLRIPYFEFLNIKVIISELLEFMSQEHTNIYDEFLEWNKNLLKKEN